MAAKILHRYTVHAAEWQLALNAAESAWAWQLWAAQYLLILVEL